MSRDPIQRLADALPPFVAGDLRPNRRLVDVADGEPDDPEFGRMRLETDDELHARILDDLGAGTRVPGSARRGKE